MLLTTISILTFFGSCSLGALVLFKNKKNPINRFFFAFASLLAIYILTSYYSIYLGSPALFKSTFATSALLKTTGFLWVFSLCKGYNFKFTMTNYALALIIIFALYLTGFVVSNIGFNGSNFSYSTGSGYLVAIVYNIIILIFGTYFLARSVITEKGIIRKKLVIITIGIIGTGILAFTTSVLLPMRGLTSLSFLDIPESLVFISASAYAMIKYKSQN